MELKMKSLFSILNLSENKKEDEHKPVFKETDGVSPFPTNTIKALNHEIRVGAKDLDKKWANALELVDNAFRVLKVPKPSLVQTERWAQYISLIGNAVNDLYDSRGLSAPWRTTDK
jgi:hypothetical protein